MYRLKKLNGYIDEQFYIGDLVEAQINGDYVLGKIDDVREESDPTNNIYFVETHEDIYKLSGNELKKYNGEPFDIIHINDNVLADINGNWCEGTIEDMSRDGKTVYVYINKFEDQYKLERPLVKKL